MGRIEDCFVFRLAKTYQQVNHAAKRRLAPYGVTPAQYGLLEVLWEANGQSGAALGERLRLDGATITGLLDRLALAGLVERRPHPTDRRINHVYLTEAGRALEQAIGTEITLLSADILRRLSHADAERFQAILAQLGEVETGGQGAGVMIVRARRAHYAWVTLALCFVALLAAQGVRLSFGAFMLPWETTFHADRGVISLVSLLSFLVYGLMQPFVGRLADRYGARVVISASVLLVGLSLFALAAARSLPQLALLYGVVASLGFGGASGVVASVAVTAWFVERRGLAFALIEAGFGAGQLLLVPSALFAIDALGWRSTLLALGLALCLVVFPLLLLFLRSRPADVGLRPYGEVVAGPATASPDDDAVAVTPRTRVMATWAFWGLVAPFFVCGFTTTGMMDTHLVPYAHDMGFSTMATSATVGALAAFNIVGTLASGPIADRWDNRVLLGSLYGVRALSLVVLLAAHQPGQLLFFGALFGLVDFATVVPTQLLASRYFGGRGLGVVFGLLSLGHQLGSALGAYLPGVVYDRTGSYAPVFAASVAILAGAALVCVTLPPARRRSSQPFPAAGVA